MVWKYYHHDIFENWMNYTSCSVLNGREFDKNQLQYFIFNLEIFVTWNLILVHVLSDETFYGTVSHRKILIRSARKLFSKWHDYVPQFTKRTANNFVLLFFFTINFVFLRFHVTNTKLYFNCCDCFCAWCRWLSHKIFFLVFPKQSNHQTIYSFLSIPDKLILYENDWKLMGVHKGRELLITTRVDFHSNMVLLSKLQENDNLRFVEQR